MARNRQKAKQRKAKRLAQEKKQSGQKPSQPKQVSQEPEPEQPDGAEQRLEEIEDEGIGRESMAGTGTAAEVELDQKRMDAELEEARKQAVEEAESSLGEGDQPHVEEPSKRGRKRRDKAADKTQETSKKAAVAKRGDDKRGKAKKQKRSKAAAKGQPRERGRVVTFFRQVWAELKRVQWPTRDQVIQATGVVVAFCAIAGLYLAGLDFVWSEAVDRLF